MSNVIPPSLWLWLATAGLCGLLFWVARKVYLLLQEDLGAKK